MEFICTTVYDKNALAVMAKALRKTLRRKHSIRSHIFGVIVILLAVFLTLPRNGEPFVLTGRTVITWFLAFVMAFAMIFEDRLNGASAGKRMMDGMNNTISRFTDSGYRTETSLGTTEWQYGTIRAIGETERYFVFLFDQNHAQVYDKAALSGGTAEDFSAFLTEKTGLSVQKL